MQPNLRHLRSSAENMTVQKHITEEHIKTCSGADRFHMSELGQASAYLLEHARASSVRQLDECGVDRWSEGRDGRWDVKRQWREGKGGERSQHSVLPCNTGSSVAVVISEREWQRVIKSFGGQMAD